MDHSLTSAFIRECKEKKERHFTQGLVWGWFLLENSLWLLGWDLGDHVRWATSPCHIFCVGHDSDM